MRITCLIISVSLLVVPALSCAPEPQETASGDTASSIELTERIDSALGEYFSDDKPGIAVIAAVDGKIIFRKGYGSADIELEVPIKPDMVFRIGSITKEFTAVLTMQLVEQGKIALDDDITKYLPDFPTHGETITIRHLLSHTSGIVDFIQLEKFQERIREDFTVQEVIDVFKNESLEFTPGEKYSYSASGYILLGAIIENLTGKTYEQVLQENICAVLGMDHTMVGGNDRIIPGRVCGYTMIDGELANDAIVTMTASFSAGSLLSSADDLAKWDEALYSDVLLKEESRELMWEPAVLNDGNKTDYGLGWRTFNFLGYRLIGHSGSIDGFVSWAVRVPNKHIFVALLANSDSPETSMFFLVKKILSVLLDISEKTAVELSEEQLGKYAGAYKRIDGRIWNVLLEEGKILLSPNPRFKQELIPESETSFFMPDSFHTVTFDLDGSGNVIKLSFNLDSGETIEAIKEQ